MRVVSRGDQHELWLERARERYDDVLDERHPDLVPGSRRHRQVDREAPALALPDVVRRPGPGEQRRLMNRDEQHLIARVEDVIGAVAVVHVPVNDHHPLEVPRVERVPRGDGDVVKQAEPHRLGR